MLPPCFPIRLLRSGPLTPNVRELVFERVDLAPFVFEAGQWVNLVLPLPSGELRRAYSIASAPDGTPRFELAVTNTGGPGSTYLHGLRPGAELEAMGPQGFFTRPLSAATPSLFVATGTGVTPLRSMLLSALGASHPAPITLLLGVRHEGDALYESAFRDLAETHRSFRFELTMSRPTDQWKGRRGHVQAHVPELVTSLGRGDVHVYVCGLLRMVGAVRELLRKELGFPRLRVHSERYD